MRKVTLIGLTMALTLLTGCGVGSFWEILGPGDLWDQINFRGLVDSPCRDVVDQPTGAVVGCMLQVQRSSEAIESIFCGRHQPQCWQAKPGFSQAHFKGRESDGVLFPNDLSIDTKGR